MSNIIERRDFLKQASAASLAMTAASYRNVLGANDRVRLGIIDPARAGRN
jgi:hypothetical protein